MDGELVASTFPQGKTLNNMDSILLSDLTGFQWSLIKPHLPVYRGGRPRKTDLRDVVDAIFYILRTGCQWRYLPRISAREHRLAVLQRVATQRRRRNHARPTSPQGPRGGRTLRQDWARRREPVGRHHLPAASSGAGQGEDRRGRNRHIVVDSMGLLMAVLVTAASIDDAEAAAELFARLDGKPMSPERSSEE